MAGAVQTHAAQLARWRLDAALRPGDRRAVPPGHARGGPPRYRHPARRGGHRRAQGRRHHACHAVATPRRRADRCLDRHGRRQPRAAREGPSGAGGAARQGSACAAEGRRAQWPVDRLHQPQMELGRHDRHPHAARGRFVGSVPGDLPGQWPGAR